ncbi:Gfo/Idh/MocA family oxidoreductase [Streptomyces sp. BHT-5-2]|uniref:Gfo/Idh/MocA family protein n=1 Tax=Streptomyces sp. BHT-5-2 TaxID=2866715 RepID=UPI001C8EEC98|nr:Gfo/Idh/MocA family oxidoreductase [Streptomyces sp. BHT-5-2]QZL06401.1 Gfo/Idh/MocA family oxidoreductase [Streptomyces sp. BHT-5-2]
MVRFGVLGTADIARRRTVPAVLRHPGCSVTAVAGRDPRKADRFAQEWRCATAPTYEALLSRDDVDAVYIPLPTGLHHPWAAAALQAGKHVLVEKPMAATADEAADLVAMARERDLAIRENFAFLHHRQHRTVRSLLAEGRIGQLEEFHSAFCIPPLEEGNIRHRADLAGGALLDTGVYPVRAAQMFLGNDLELIGAVLRYDRTLGVDVGGTALLRSVQGIAATLTFGIRHAYGSGYRLWGSAARAELSRAFTPPGTWTPSLRLASPPEAEELPLPADDQFANAVGSFASAVQGMAQGEERAGWGADAVRTLEIVDAIRRHARREEL